VTYAAYGGGQFAMSAQDIATPPPKYEDVVKEPYRPGGEGIQVQQA